MSFLAQVVSKLQADAEVVARSYTRLEPPQFQADTLEDATRHAVEKEFRKFQFHLATTKPQGKAKADALVVLHKRLEVLAETHQVELPEMVRHFAHLVYTLKTRAGGEYSEWSVMSDPTPHTSGLWSVVRDKILKKSD